MKSLEFKDDAIQIDAAIVAKALGIGPLLLMELLREGKVTSLCERGIDADNGRYRLTFFAENRRVRLIVEDEAVVQCSAIDFGDSPLPVSARRPGP